MANSILNNVAALQARKHLGSANTNLSRVIERVSSGRRINRAADDPAGLAISNSLRADIRALGQAERNANDGVSITQVVAGSMDEIANILTRAVELAEQAASGTSGADNSVAKQALNDEYTALKAEITRIVAATDFNGSKVLAGELDVSVQVGIDENAYSRIDIALADSITVSGGGANSLGLTSGSTTLNTAAGAQTEIGLLGTAIDTISGLMGDFGAIQSRLEHASANITNLTENMTAAESQIRDADMALEIVNLTKYQILTQSATAALANANASQGNLLALLS